MAGAFLAIDREMDLFGVIFLGVITAVGGGILRDVCMNREPEAFQAGTLYGSAALIGSTAYALMAQNHILEQYAPWACAAIVLALRYASLLLGWRTKPPRDYTDVVTKAVARPVRSVARRVRPPKGKVERDRERTGYERLRRIWRAPGSTSPLPPVAPDGKLSSVGSPPTDAKPAAAGKPVGAGKPTGDVEAAGSKVVAEERDPSDRIVIGRAELNRLKQEGENPEPSDPFEPSGLADPAEPPDPFEPKF